MDHWLRIVLLGALLPLLSGCPSEQRGGPAPTPDPEPAVDAGPPCDDGQTRSCDLEPGCLGVEVCEGGAFGACAGRDELCNGADDDCDGEADEAIAGAGEECTVERGTCRAPGLTACDPDAGRVVCRARFEDAPDELCNGLDDDCDGATDEMIPPAPCIAGVGGCRVEGRAFCRGGQMQCGAEPAEPAAELCNGADDDCDGRTDEDASDVGRACGTSLPGLCAAGRRVCDGGAPVCQPETLGAAEACNGLDDDCDGATDEDFAIGDGCIAGIGACAVGGVRRCVEGAPACVATPGMPTAEICNGVDDDCDGATDEQPARPEICNGLDDDCDGATDEGFDVGAPCAVGDGRCETPGLTACVADGAVACDALPGDPEDEICNQVDDDCDGAVDEGLGFGAPCEVGVGACVARGEGICGDAGAVMCFAEPGAPQPETCDGRDDDCDGATDEGFPVGQPCAVGRGQCRAEGALRCADDGGTTCDVEAGAPVDELCNEFDDDCDGRVDEDFPIDAACLAGEGACAARGIFACADDGRLRCDADVTEPSDERCNAIDDDCDSRIDEGLGLGQSCPVGHGICAAEGVRICGEGGEVACAGEPGPARDERCDGLDDDCDGAIDEDFDPGEDCEIGRGACARPGVRACDDNGGARCVGEPGAPSAELCNGLDDDCDGAVDEVRSCVPYDSCEDARLAGGASGTYLIIGLEGAPYSVWCDQDADGGGWTLVANSLGAPPADQRAMWSTDLQSPTPADAYAGVWPALRRLWLRHDIRFVCGPAAGGPPTVDIGFYDVNWYRTITTGADRDSCFNEADGRGAAQPTIRRDNLTGDVRALGQGRYHPDGDWLEGEDACGDAEDFAVDFDGRGLGDAQPTAWGAFDGLPRCGAAPLDEAGAAGTRWQIWARPPRANPLGTVGLLGPDRLIAPLTGSGFAVELIEGDPIPDLARYRVIFFGRQSDDWQALPAGTQAALDAHLRRGGGLVTEFDGAALLGEGYDLGFVLGLGAPDPWGWLPMTVGDGGPGRVRSLDAHPDAAGDPILRSLPDAVRGARGPASFVQPDFGGPPPGRIVTTSQPVAGEPFVSTLRVNRCGGVLLMGTGSYEDAAQEADIGQLVRNLAGAAASPPPVGVDDVCPD